MSALLYGALVLLSLLSLVLLLPFVAALRSSLLPLLSLLSVPFLVLLALSVLLLSTSYLDLNRHRALALGATSGGVDYCLHSTRALEAELSCVQCLAVVGLLLLLARLTSLLRETDRLKASLTAMERQAKGAAAAYLTGLDSAKPTTATASAPPPPSVDVAALREEKERLERRLQAMERQARGASEAFLQSETVQDAAKGQQLETVKAELAKAKADNAKLREQLDDFQLVMGDARKKTL
jgi:hypothetical protein